MSYTGRVWLIPCLLLFTVFPLSGAAVSVIVVESGLHTELPGSESSNLWESGLMNALFDGGHIVSNVPITRSGEEFNQGEFPEELNSELNEALEGGMEYILLAFLDYEGYAEADIPRPTRISLKLFKVRPLKLIIEQQYRGTNFKSPGDVYTMAGNAARMLIPHFEKN
jgi:hypothetical protein